MKWVSRGMWVAVAAAMGLAFPSIAEITPPTVGQGWTGSPIDPAALNVGESIRVWMEGSPSTFWSPSWTGTVMDQWGGTHVTTGCTVTDGTGASGNAAACWSRGGDAPGGHYETNAPNQHGEVFPTTWLGTNGLVGGQAATATVLAANHANPGGAPVHGDSVTFALPPDQYEEWVLHFNDPVPAYYTAGWGVDWSDFVITLRYVADYNETEGIGGDTSAWGGWLMEKAEFTAYAAKGIYEVPPYYDTIHVVASHFRRVISDAGYVGYGDLGCAWNGDRWGTAKNPVPCNYWKPGFREAPQAVAGNTFWETCRSADPAANPLGACVGDAPSAYDPSTGYIRAGDNVHGELAAFHDSYGGFGELIFGQVPEPGTALLLGGGLIGLAGLRGRNRS